MPLAHMSSTMLTVSQRLRWTWHTLARAFSSSATFEVSPFKLHRLDQGPSTSVSIPRNKALKMFRRMNTIRNMEAAAGKLDRRKVLRGYRHLHAGEEACAVGIRSSMNKDVDNVIVSFRDHAWAYVMEVPIAQVLAELTGERLGMERGKVGSMHLYTKNFYGGSGIAGAQVPLGAGLALAHQYKRDGGVTIATYENSAANKAQIYEAFNMAKLWKLPLIFVCENNQYAMGTSVEKVSANPDFYAQVDYIPGIRVDGMDVLAVREATRFAREHCVTGKGPIILECVTYAFYGHSMTDPDTTSSTHEEGQKSQENQDPIQLLKERLLSGLATREEVEAIEESVKQDIEAATELAKAYLEPAVQELTEDIYALNLEGLIRGVTSRDFHEHKNVGTRINLK